MIHLYDGNNWVRRLLEFGANGGAGLTIRNTYTELNAKKEPVIVCWDGPHGNAARKKIYEGYKAHREQKREDIYKQLELVRTLLKMSNVIQVRVPEYEADDVIAKIAMRYRDRGVIIYSNDKDYAQLPGVTLEPKPAGFKVEPRWVRLYKATVGDPSDNVPGIKDFGPKSWEAVNKETLERLVTNPSHTPKDFGAERLGVSQKIYKWLLKDENLKQIRIFYEVVGFIDVPDELIDKHTTVGKPNPEAVQKIFQEYLF